MDTYYHFLFLKKIIKKKFFFISTKLIKENCYKCTVQLFHKKKPKKAKKKYTKIFNNCTLA